MTDPMAEAREQIKNVILADIRRSEKSSQIARIIYDLGLKYPSQASALWNELISKHSPNDRKFYLTSVYKHMISFEQPGSATELLLLDMDRGKGLLSWTYPGTNKAGRAKDLIAALLNHQREDDAITIAKYLLDVEEDQEKAFHRLLYSLYYALGPEYGASYGDAEIDEASLIRFLDRLSADPLFSGKMAKSINYVRHIIKGIAMETKESAKACIAFAEREVIVFTRTLYYNRVHFSARETVRILESHYKQLSEWGWSLTFVDCSAEIAEWVYSFIIQSDWAAKAFFKAYSDHYSDRYTEWVIRTAITQRQESLLRQHLVFMLNEHSDSHSRRTLKNMILELHPFISSPPPEQVPVTIQDDSVDITIFYTPNHLSIFSGEAWFRNLLDQENAHWFLHIVEKVIHSPKVTEDFSDILQAIEEAKKAPESIELHHSIPLQELLKMPDDTENPH